ncbi:helix-turn-helix domain-containing protein [Puia dinghuensis]|uniref:HTH araC/xylS-type domain-containing protein n=1 Tax=Puia dinghuensis TaxID=1792502 RepID=A0A8J2UHW8_9BACT|nr:helix-turn-helix domain-containing protein [Puia dinghuensis]GGB20560.1 hypothetical protein GCM10011511_50370 [Puia dinghuensis]
MNSRLKDKRGHSLRLNEDDLMEMDGRIRELFDREKPYLQHRYMLAHLSEDTGISQHRLSAFINRRYSMHFNDLINMYRIYYCIDQFGKKEWMIKTLSALAGESGFSNRNTFSSAFKKFTGMNPSKYFANYYKS